MLVLHVMNEKERKMGKQGYVRRSRKMEDNWEEEKAEGRKER